ncbi:DUF6383 domain-containing protein [Parabacteroides sp.]
MNKKISTLLAGVVLMGTSFGASAQATAPTGTTGQYTYDQIINDGTYYVITNGTTPTNSFAWTRNNASGKDSLDVNKTIDFSTASFAEMDSALWKLVRKPGAGEVYEIVNKATQQKLAFSSDWKKRTSAIVSASSTGAISQFSVGGTNKNIPYATFGANGDSVIFLSTTAGELKVEEANAASQSFSGALNLNYFRKPAARTLTKEDLNKKLATGGFQLFFSYKDQLTTANNALAGVIFEADATNATDTLVKLKAKLLAPKFSASAPTTKMYQYAYIDTISYDPNNASADGDKLTFKVDTLPTNGTATQLTANAYTFRFRIDPSSAKDSVAVFVTASYDVTSGTAPKTWTDKASALTPTGLGGFPLQIAPLAGTSTDKLVLTTGKDHNVTTALPAETRISFTGGATPAPLFDATKVYSVKVVNDATTYDAAKKGKYMVVAPTSATAYGAAYSNSVFDHLPSTQFVFDGAQMINRELASVDTDPLYTVEGKTDVYTNLTDTFEIKAMANVNLQDSTMGWSYISADSLTNYAFSLDYISGILEGRSINVKTDSSVVATTEEGKLFKLEAVNFGKVANAADIDEVKTLYNQAYKIFSKDKKFVVVKNGTTGKLALTSITSAAGATPTSFYLKETENKGEYILVEGTSKYNVNSTNEALEAVGLNLNNNAFAVQVEKAPEYVLDAKGHYNIENLRGDMLAADANGFGMFRKEGELKAAYGKEDFALYIDTAKIHATQPSYFILSGAKTGEGSELEGNFLRVMSDSTSVNEDYKAGNGWARLAFVPAKREATSDSLLVNYQNEELTKADSVDYKGKNTGKIGQFQFKIQYTDNEGEYIVENAAGYLATYNDVLCLLTTANAALNDPQLVKLTQVSAPTANEGVAVSEVTVIAGEGQVTIAGAQGKKVVVTNVLGQVITNTVITSDNAPIAAPQGVVVVAVEGEEAVKAIVK